MFNFGSSNASSSPVKLDLYTPEQKALFAKLSSIIQPGLANEIPAYPGNMYLPRQPEESAYFSYANQVANQSDTYMKALNNVLTGNIYPQISPEVTKAYFANNVQPLMRQNWQDVVAPQVKESFAGPGYWSTARADAERSSASNEALAESSTLANLMYQNQLMNWQSNMTGANAIASSSLPALVYGANITGTAGQYARNILEEQNIADYLRWTSGETIDGVTPIQYSPFMQLAFQMLGQQPYTYGTNASSSGFSFGLQLPEGLI